MTGRDVINVKEGLGDGVSLNGRGLPGDAWNLQGIIDRSRPRHGLTLYFPPGDYLMQVPRSWPDGSPSVHIGLTDPAGNAHPARQGLRFVGEGNQSILRSDGRGTIFAIAGSDDLTFERLSFDASRDRDPHDDLAGRWIPPHPAVSSDEATRDLGRPTALATLRRIRSKMIRREMVAAIDALAKGPESQGKTLSAPLEGLFTIRASRDRYRALYRVDERIVRVLLIGRRRPGKRTDVRTIARSLLEVLLGE